MKHIFHIYHPTVIFLYLVLALGGAMLTLHPVYLLLSFVVGSVYAVYLRGWRSYLMQFRFLLPVLVVVAVANPLFNHRGMTVLFYFLENPITLEATLYGLCTGLMLCCVFIWFSCYQVLMTNEKFLYLFGRIVPTIALMISMILKLIPQTQYKARCVANAQTAMGMGIGQGKKREGIKRGIRMTSILMGWSMEDSIETADSMRARGYGAAKRTSYSPFRIQVHDVVALAMLLVLGTMSVWGILGETFSFYPKLSQIGLRPVAYGRYLLLLAYPLLLEGKEWLAWR